jgi:hypothetical protein
MVPATVFTVLAVVLVGPPAPAFVIETVTFAAGMVPAGKFEPMTETLVTPGSATAGKVTDSRVTETGLWAIDPCVA